MFFDLLPKQSFAETALLLDFKRLPDILFRPVYDVLTDILGWDIGRYLIQEQHSVKGKLGI